MKSKKEKFFSDLYRIWKVGETTAEKILFLKEFEGIVFTTEGDDENENLRDIEDQFLYHNCVATASGEEIEGVEWPTAQDIYIGKYYWEHGVVADISGRLRYFKNTFTDVFENNDISKLDEQKQLSWCEKVIIVSGKEKEIYPNAQFC